jgi:hypothetical protein
MKVIERSMGYFQDMPAMILRSAGRDNKKRFVIKLDDIWKYSDTHNPLFEDFMANKVIQICMLFEIDVPKDKRAFVQLMASVSDTIMGGIDELVSLKPYQEGVSDPNSVVDPNPDVDKENRIITVH